MRYIWKQSKAVACLASLAVLSAGLAPAGEAPNVLSMARQLNEAFIQVADQLSPAVVVIRVAYKANRLTVGDDSNSWDSLPPELRKFLEPYRNELQPQPRRREAPAPAPRRPPGAYDGQGSGVVIREEGYILTNRHVVDEAEKIQVRFKDDAQWYDAEVRGVDAQSDVAVLKIDPKGRKLTMAKLGDSEKVRVGEFAVAIGAPFELDYSVTFGHVSAKGRSHIIPDMTMDQDFIQTDANINPGNSGGPLVNIEGEVIGINTLIRGLHTGIGFAIPINLAREVAEKLITDGKYVRAYLGIKIRALRDDPDARDAIGGTSGIKDGVVVMEIPPEGPAAKSDLKAGDVITSVEGKSVVTAQQLKSEIRGRKIGEAVSLDVHRNGKNIKVKVKPEAWPDETASVVQRGGEPTSGEQGRGFGLTVRANSKDLAEKFGLEKVEGVIVTEVERGSLGELKGFRPGDVITDINGKAVNTVREFREAMKSADLKKGVIIIFTSRGTSKFEVLRESGE